MKQWVVYLLRCRGGSLYTGITNDLRRRLAAHQAGKGAKYTRAHLPVTLAWKEVQKSATAARKREAEIKRLKKGEKEALILYSR